MTTELPLCATCKHYKGRRICDAYPGGIPTEIWISSVDHREPHEGDNGIQFEDAGRWVIEDEE